MKTINWKSEMEKHNWLAFVDEKQTKVYAGRRGFYILFENNWTLQVDLEKEGHIVKIRPGRN